MYRLWEKTMNTAQDSVLVRYGMDDFDAMKIADAMQSITGVDVISVVKAEGWHVFAKFASSVVSIEEIDNVINAAFDSCSGCLLIRPTSCPRHEDQPTDNCQRRKLNE